MPKQVVAVLSVALLDGGLDLSACGDDSKKRPATRSLSGPRRTSPTGMAVQNQIIADFTQKTGIKVKLVGVDEDQFSQMITVRRGGGRPARRDRGAAAGRGPHAGGQRAARHRRHAGQVVDELGPRHVLGAGAGARPRDGDKQLAVPSDGVGAAAALPQGPVRRRPVCRAPDTYDDVDGGREG